MKKEVIFALVEFGRGRSVSRSTFYRYKKLCPFDDIDQMEHVINLIISL